MWAIYFKARVLACLKRSRKVVLQNFTQLIDFAGRTAKFLRNAQT